MDLPTAVLLVVLVALGVMIVIVLEHRLSRIRRRQQTSISDAVEPRAEEKAVSSGIPAAVPAPEPAPAGAPTHDLASIGSFSHVLMQADTELAFLTTIRLDPPWLECAFEPTPAFGSVHQLFDRELELLEHTGGMFDQAAFVEQWQGIFAAGLWIRADPNGKHLSEHMSDHISQFLLHVHPDGTARLRYG